MRVAEQTVQDAGKHDTRQRGTRDRRALVETVLIVLGLIAYQVLLEHDKYSDGQVRFDELQQLLEHGTLSSQIYSLVGPIFATPLYLLGHFYSSPARWVVRYNSLLFTLAIAVCYWLLRHKVDRGVLRTFFMVLIAASMFPAHVGNFYGETFTALTVGVGLLAAVFGPSLVGWGAVVLGVANTPGALVGLALVVARRIADQKRWRYVIVLVATVALVGGENWLRRGSPLNSGYGSSFNEPLALGVLSILFSFGKGLVFFMPALFLPLRRSLEKLPGTDTARLWTVYTMWMLFVAGMILVYANWQWWDGAWYWGPRYFLFASLPASLVLAVRLRDHTAPIAAKLITLGALAVCGYGAINSVLFGMQTLVSTCFPNHFDLCDYAPNDSILIHPLLIPSPVSLKATLFALYVLVVFGYLAMPFARDVASAALGWARERQLNRMGWIDMHIWRWF